MASHAETQAALYTAIKESADAAKAIENRAVRASVLRDLALAFRFAAGGQQPGGVHVDK